MWRLTGIMSSPCLLQVYGRKNRRHVVVSQQADNAIAALGTAKNEMERA
jgi:hypothetical protein